MDDLDLLLEPIDIGSTRLRNRVVMTGHGTGMAEHNLPSEQHAAYYAERARGGVGYMVMAFPQIHPSSRNVQNEVFAYDDAVVPGLQRIADRVHEHGGAIGYQLGHGGRQSSSLWSERALWAPSAIPCPLNREMPKAMEIEDIDEIVAAHGTAARLAQDGGMDAVEIHSGYGGYLLSSFLSPYMNHRDDEYGGSLDNRMRLLLRCLQSVRDAVGPTYTVGMNLQGHDYSPDGIEIGQAQQVARTLAATGQVDYFVVKGSTYFVASQNVPDMQHPRGLWAPLASAIKEVVDIPVIAVGRLTDPVEAAGLLRDGHADLVAMTRQHIADPETVTKIREKRLEDIRGCIACNQGCIDMLFKGHHTTCVHNPAAGYEQTLGHGTLQITQRPQRVVVVGGGPAGMKAAEVAARQGHDVTLLERRAGLGGQIALAATVRGREEVGEVVRHLEVQLRKLGVSVRTGVDVTAQAVLDLAPDRVVVATGSRPPRVAGDGEATRRGRRIVGDESRGAPLVPGLDQSHVLDVFDILEHRTPLGRRLLLVDDGEGGWKGIALALALAGEHEVHYATPLPYVGAALGPFTQNRLVPRVFDAGVHRLPFTTLRSIDGPEVLLRSEGSDSALGDVDNVVLVGWHEPVQELYFALKGHVPDLVRVGDAVASRGLLEAVHEAERTVRAMAA